MKRVIDKMQDAKQINEVEKLTGLSAKAIRFYENKGLIDVCRMNNLYRIYDNKCIQRLLEIKLYRKLGFSIADLILIKDNVVSVSEVAQKRLNEVAKEAKCIQNQAIILSKLKDYPCDAKIDEFLNYFDDGTTSDENAEIKRYTNLLENNSLALGIDIGTTTICASVIDSQSGNLVESFSIANNSDLQGQEFLQDSNAIIRRCKSLIDSVIDRYKNIKSIGIAGQMHGIVYLDENFYPISPLYTWQNNYGNELYKDNMTYCHYITKKTDFFVASGYGLVTHFYNMQNGKVPKTAFKLCTIMDCLVQSLTKNKQFYMHSTNAASLGLFDIVKNSFCLGSLAKLNINQNLIPHITSKNQIAGEYKGIAVGVAIGDNQSSFLGSVGCVQNSVLVNIGTGSQISVLADSVDTCRDFGSIETRPYVDGKFLFVGSPLCGGKAYAVLEEFFRNFALAIGAEDKPLYSVMNSLAAKASKKQNLPIVSTQFNGTRKNPLLRGSIKNISMDNFSAENLAYATLQGIVDELFSMYSAIVDGKIKPEYIVASGNAVRKNPLLQELLQKTFGLCVCVPLHMEEAAFGAAMYSMLCANSKLTQADLSKLIKFIKL